MFTSKKCFLPMGISVALSSLKDLNDLYIIANKVLTYSTAEEAPTAKVAEAFP